MTESPIVSVKPIVLPAPDRGEDLRVRVSAPATGENLPVVLFAHGFGSSLDGYGPLTDHWAAQGFVVVQATHLDSRTVGLPEDDPRTPRIWRYRIEDVKRLLDDLGVLIDAVPGLSGRVDSSRVAVAGHSFGGRRRPASSGCGCSARTANRARICPIPGSRPRCCWRRQVPAART